MAMDVEDLDLEVREVDSFLSKVRGLMFRRKSKFDYCLLFKFKRESKFFSAIHSFFVLFRFDAVFLDEDKEIVDIKRNIRPFNPCIMPGKPSKFLLEMPAGKADEEDLEVGDKIDF